VPEYPALGPRCRRAELWKSCRIQGDRDSDENSQAGVNPSATNRFPRRPLSRFQPFDRFQVSDFREKAARSARERTRADLVSFPRNYELFNAIRDSRKLVRRNPSTRAIFESFQASSRDSPITLECLKGPKRFINRCDF
jgi:hypothetical protein